MKDHSISGDQARYATSIFAKYLYTSTIEASTKFYKNTFPYDMIFTKDNTSISDKQVEELTSKFNIHFRYCIGSLIYLLSARVDCSFLVHKVAKFWENLGKVHIEGFLHISR